MSVSLPDRFLQTCSRLLDEKNDKLKILIRNKTKEYLDRAEKLRAHIAKADEKRTRATVGASGGGSKTMMIPRSRSFVRDYKGRSYPNHRTCSGMMLRDWLRRRRR